VPEKESNIVTGTLNGLISFFFVEIADTIAQPSVYAFLFYSVEVDNIQMPSPYCFISTFKAILFYPIVLENRKGDRSWMVALSIF